MIAVKPSNPGRSAEALAGLERLRGAGGSAQVFWQTCTAVLADAAGARLAVLLRGGSEESGGWKKVIVLPAEAAADEHARKFFALAGDLAEAALQHGAVCRGAPGSGFLLAVRLVIEQSPEARVGAFFLAGVSQTEAEEALLRLRLLAHLPVIYQMQQQAIRSETAVAHFASVLELMTHVNAHQRFMAAAMAFCNELGAQHGCERVSIGWVGEEYVRLQAMSHSEKFEKRMEAVKVLESAMEEALDQDQIIVSPAPEEQRLVTRDHALLAETHKVAHVCSLPLRLDGEPIAVLTCERASRAFTEVDVRLLALCGEMAIRRLADLKRTDRWFGARWLATGRERLAALIGLEHTGAKLLGVLVAVAIGTLIFGTWNYRVEASFSLRTLEAGFVSAPFDGYIEEVKVEVGDKVEKGSVLATLDTRDVLLQEAAAMADRVRFQREIDKARGADKIAEASIAEAQAEQAEAKLELVRFHRSQAGLLAPFAGAVIEGDLRKRIGAPVKQGDVMFKIARTDRLYVECAVHERDVHELRNGARGHIAFASLPKLTFPVRIVRVEPAALARENANVVLTRCTFETEPPDWARPGMSGIAKLEVGERSLFWVVTHRTVDFLRLYFWW